LLYDDVEGTGDDLGVQLTFVTTGDGFEFLAVIGDEARKDIEAAGGAFGVGAAGDIGRKSELLFQRDDVDFATFERGRFGERDRFRSVVPELAVDGGMFIGEKAGVNAVGKRAEAKIDAGGLDLFRKDGTGGEDMTALDEIAEALGRKDPGGVPGFRGKVEAGEQSLRELIQRGMIAVGRSSGAGMASAEDFGGGLGLRGMGFGEERALHLGQKAPCMSRSQTFLSFLGQRRHDMNAIFAKQGLRRFG
jgi:hypothetical protein